MPADPLRDWVLRPARDDDADRLHALLGVPDVYRYLCDGVPAPRDAVDGWIARSHADFRTAGVGMWMLEDPRGGLDGCVRLEVQGPRRAELVYLLHPRVWGRGLATRMAWTVIRRAFDAGFDEIIAGADGPNTASVAVMRRLGMRHLRAVEYDLGPGVEYRLTAVDAGPTPPPTPVAVVSPS